MTDIVCEIYISEVGKGKYIGIFDGETIVTGTSEPALSACRVLKFRGLTGLLGVYDAKTHKLRFTVDIGKGSSLTVENDKFKTYRERALEPS